MLPSNPTLVPTEGSFGRFVANVRSLIQQDMSVKDIPSSSISITRHCERVYCESFGFKDAEKTQLADENTVFRVGSITKLFTDLALMLAVDAGLVSLEDPVSKYLPDFTPHNPYAVALNCRHLVAHSSGLSREPPRGHYFDSDPSITLSATVLSLDATSVLYEPGTTQKYSNAAIAVVGLVLERVYGKPWAQLMQELILKPLDMQRSSCEWSEEIQSNLAQGAMFSPDFRLDKTPPSFPLGESPAGQLYSTVSDLEKFNHMIQRRGTLPNGKQLVKPEIIDQILTPQYPDANRQGAPHTFGIGWQLSTYANVEIAGHSGAIYGYTSRLVIATKKDFSLIYLTAADFAPTSLKAITNYIIEHMGKLIEGETKFPRTTYYDLPVDTMKSIEGAYIEKGEGNTYPGYGDVKFRRRVHLDNRFGKLMIKHDGGFSRLMMQKKEWNTPTGLVNEDGEKAIAKAHGAVEEVQILSSSSGSPSSGGDFAFQVVDRFQEYDMLNLTSDLSTVTWCGVAYEREQIPEPCPELCPDLDRFLGEYGPDHAPVFVFERYGRLFVLMEWLMQYPLRRASESELASLSSTSLDSNPNILGKREVWVLPSENCFYTDEKLIFQDYDASGVPNALECTGMLFERRLRNVSSDKTFHIDALKSVADLRVEAQNSAPPAALTVSRLSPDLVDMSTLKPEKPFLFDIRYATENNFMGAAFYKLPKAFAQRPAAHSIEKAHNWLTQHGYGLVIFDIYRPWHVTKMFFEATPLHLRHFVAPPETGSIHNRGCAIDCGLYELNTGRQITMVSGFDEMTPRAYRDYPGGSTRQRWYQTLLRTAMQRFDFEVYEYEWWHFNYASQKDYPVMNVAFEDL